MSSIAILGAGMAGFGAAYRLHMAGARAVLYERESHHGGHAASYLRNGFIFDDGPHISFTENKRIQELFAESVNHEYETIQARAINYWRGYWIKHPAQCNLYGLPENVVADILVDFVEAQNNSDTKIRTYEDWLVATYGRTFAETFPVQYGLKYHTTQADNMTTDWVAPRFYKPNLREIVHGAVSPTTPNVHYVSHFRYPSKGGFVSFLNMFSELTDCLLNHELIRVDPKSRELKFANSRVVSYEYLISSMPLPELIPMIEGVPSDVLEAAQRLACTTCVLVNIAVDRDNISEVHWIYFYDQDFFFTRLSFPHMLSPNNAPPGTGSIQAEIYYSKKYRPLDRSAVDCIQPVIRDLRRCGLLQKNDTILSTEARTIPYANVIFDLDRPRALSTVKGYLDDIGIVSCGRYGEWGYHWTDDSFINGENAAQTILDSM
jgi:protoporphyrinogen oxidase